MSTIALTTSWKKIYTVASQSDGYRTWTAQCWMKYNSQSVANNTTTIAWEIDVYTTSSGGGSGYYNDGQPFELWLKNSSGTETKLYKNDSYSIGTIADGSYKKIADGTYTVTHDNDGTCALGVWFKGSSFGKTETANYTNSIKLPTIARASTFTITAPSSTIANGSNTWTINITRASSSFTHTLKYSCTGTHGTIGTGVGISKTWKPAANIFDNAPNVTSMSCTITCETYSGSTKIGSTTKSTTLKIDEATYKPTISSTSCTETNSVLTNSTIGLSSGWETVNLLSKKNLQVNFSIMQGATVSSVTCSVGNVSNKAMTISGSSPLQVATCTINYPTAAVYTFKVTDSRGLSTTATSGTSSNWKNYSKPTVATLTASRDENTAGAGTLSTTGSYWTGSVNGKSNTLTYSITQNSTALTSGNGSSGNWTLSNYSLSNLSDNVSYTYTVTATDLFNQKAIQTFVLKKLIVDPLWVGKDTAIVNNFLVNGRALLMDYTQTYFVDMTPVWWVGSFTSPAANYGDSDSYRPRAYRQGNLVSISGIAKIGTSTTLSDPSQDSITLFTLPEGFRPAGIRRTICQGSSMNRWLLAVTTTGAVTLARYGTTSPTATISGQWLPFSFTFEIKSAPANTYYTE